MSVKSASPTPPQTDVPVAIPATQYERFVAALPEIFRQQCRSKLDGTGLAANHPVFLALAELYEKENENPPRNFIHEATLHATQSAQLLHELRSLPATIMAQIEPQLLGLLSALNHPLQKLEAISIAAQVTEKLPPVLSDDIPAAPPQIANPLTKEAKPDQLARKSPLDGAGFFSTARSTVSHAMAWVVTGSICAAVAVILFTLGSARMAHSYEAAYRDRVAHMEADAATDTIALNRLLVAGITLRVEQSPDHEGWYLILPGARKAAQPVNSPEGLAVEVWP